ncbi:type VII secretion target [Nocardia sp. NPDC024068]|uniref:type VII secretion target n=1 Tax=Nocardia sp. NPDC024068 TaxID=3157197 RepID=UPI003411A4CE
MSDPVPVQVDPEALRTHATSVQQLTSRLATVLQAANYINSADDGYGVIPKPLVSWLLADSHGATVEAIRKLDDTVGAVPGKLAADADSFAGADGALAKALEGMQTTVDGATGGL